MRNMVRQPHKYISYLRVSTARQGRSGLGVEAQRESVQAYLHSVGNGAPILEFVEVESGKRDDRPQLAQAIEACKLYGARLVIAKLDRLSRDAHFLIGLQKAGVPFVAADMPEANEMVVGIMAVVAQAERKMISERTKAALAAAKKRGVKLGNPNPPRGDAEKVAVARSVFIAKAKERARRYAEPIAKARAAGAKSLREIADFLNRAGIPAPRGGAWQIGNVHRLLRALGQS
jgi:DNA invertase Pin-like site-specific DNA recombinase